MANFKNKISYLISNQIPEYIRNQNPKFVAFLEAYYDFLEKDSDSDALLSPDDLILNLQDWLDIDSTLDTFVDVMRKQYAWDIPEETIINNRKIIKNIGDFYASKGASEGTELFFRLIYDTAASVVIPGELILCASDGVWTQQKYVKIFAGDYGQNIFDLIGKRITLKYVDILSGGAIIPKEIDTVVENVIGTNNDKIFKAIVDIDPDIEFYDDASILDFRTYFSQDYTSEIYVEVADIYLEDPDNLIKVWFNDTIFGSLSRQIVSAIITLGGSKFKRGENFFIDEQGVFGAYFSNSPGLFVEFDDYASNNLDNRIIIRVMDTETSIVGEYDSDYFLEDYTIITVDGAITNVKIISTGYQIFQKTFSALISNGRFGGSFAEISLESGYVATGEKHYEGSRGLISSVNKIQDSKYYQPYSYVIRSEIPTSTWSDIYKTSIHPAGMNVIGEQLLVGNDVDFSSLIVESKIYGCILDLLFDIDTVIDDEFTYKSLIGLEDVSPDSDGTDFELLEGTDTISTETITLFGVDYDFTVHALDGVT